MTNSNSRDTGSSSISAEDIFAEMKRIKAELGPPPPPPPQVRFSKHVPALIPASPDAAPRTDDMRQMCDDIGPQRVSGGYRINTQFGEMIVLNSMYKP